MDSTKGNAMSFATNAEPNLSSNRREDFLISSFKHLEARLQGIRRKVMKRAAEIARRESPPGEEVFEVGAGHVDRALSELLDDQEACKRAAGVSTPKASGSSEPE
jgi:hypothetical protein